MTKKRSREQELQDGVERPRDRLAEATRSGDGPGEGERAISETGRRLSTILSAMSEHVVLQDRDHTVLWANRAAAESIEMETPALIGNKCHMLWNGSDNECPGCPVGRVWTSLGEEEAEVTTPDGRVWYIRGYPLFDEDGDLESVLEVTRDITHRRQAEVAMRETEERYRVLADSSIEGIVIHEDGVILEVNKRVCEISGFAPDELIGESMERFLSPESLHSVTRQIAKGATDPYEIQTPAKDGSMLELEVMSREATYKGRPVRVAVVRDVRARKAAERALRESEERYRLLTDNLHDVVWTMDLDLNYTYISPSVEMQRGFTPVEMLGKSIEEVMTPGSLEKVHQVVDEVLAPIIAGKVDPHTNVTLELEMYTKDGGTVDTEMSISLLLDEDDVPIVILGVTRDITERREAKEAIHESQSLYRLLAQNVDDVIFTMGPDLEFRYVSPSLERVTGFNSKELREMGWQGILVPDSVEDMLVSISEDVLGLRDAEAEGTPSTTLEVKLKRKEVGNVWAEIKVSLLRDADGEVTGLLGVARDITERRAAEEVIRESEERYRLLAENVADIIFILGMDREFTYVSPSFEKVTGYSVEELLTMGWQDILTPDSLETAMSVMAENLIESMEEGTSPYESVILEMGVVSKGGDLVWVEVRISLIYDPEGDVKGILGVARDITERKETEEQFMEEKKRAELYLDLFGHDIRNINQGIMSYLELMLMRPGLDPEEADYIRNVLVQATRINDLVAKVQRLTQLRTRTVVVEDVNVGRLVQGAIDYVVAKHPDRTVTVWGGERCGEFNVRGSNLLLDVFTSILDNAVRFDRNEEVVVDIECEPSEDDRWLRISFADRGPGLPDEMKEKVFKRLDQPEGGVKGSGLGLTVVWEIIKRVDGRVWVEDRVEGEPAQGCRFVVELPRDGER